MAYRIFNDLKEIGVMIQKDGLCSDFLAPGIEKESNGDKLEKVGKG